MKVKISKMVILHCLLIGLMILESFLPYLVLIGLVSTVMILKAYFEFFFKASANGPISMIKCQRQFPNQSMHFSSLWHKEKTDYELFLLNILSLVYIGIRIRKLIEKKGGMMHAYANSKAHCTADWGQILINQLFALPSPKTQTAQS